MASSVQPLIQMALNTCQEHTDEELDMYCKTCKKAVCSECVKAYHIHHDWVPMSKYTRELRSKAQVRVLEVNSVADSLYKGHREMYEFWKDKNDRECSKISFELESMRSRLHDLIDGIMDDRKKEVQNLRDAHNEKIATNDIQREWEKLKKMTLQLSEEASTLSNADIIELFDDIEKSLSAMTSMSTFSGECFQHFLYEKGKVEKSDLEEMVGNITKESSTVIDTKFSPLKESHFRNDRQDDSRSEDEGKKEKQEEDNTIYCIRPLSECSAWISCGGQCRVVNIELDTADTLKTRHIIKHLGVSDDGALYIHSYKDQSILKCSEASETSEIKTISETTPLLPTCLTITRSGDLLISLVDEWLPTRSPTSRRLLRRMTETGLTLMEYQYDNDGTTPLFTGPWKSVEHYHGQICVINRFMNESEKFRGVVYGLGPAGHVQYRYNNNNEKFCPHDLCSDMIGNTLILDKCDLSLHCVNPKGFLLKRLELQKLFNFIPFRITLHKNTLWIGSYKTGQVNVYEYNYERTRRDKHQILFIIHRTVF